MGGSHELNKLLASKYARKLKYGEIKFVDIPKEYREEVIREMKENGFTMEIEPVG